MAVYDEFKHALIKIVTSDVAAKTVTLVYHRDPTAQYVYDCENVGTFDTEFSDFLNTVNRKNAVRVVDNFIQKKVSDGSLTIKS